MKRETSGKIKFGVWGLVFGVAIAIIVGFGWGGWTTAGTTEKRSEAAVLASQTSICVAQFMNDPNHQEKLKEFGKLDTWRRSDFVEEGGWDKMPGQKEAGYAVAQACAAGLQVLINKDGK
jgi:hypothetical protein